MQKKLLVLMACLSLVLPMTGCTSKDSKQDSEAAGDYDSADLEKLDQPAAEVADKSLDGGQLPEDSLGETSAAPPNEQAAAGTPGSDTPAVTPTTSEGSLAAGDTSAVTPPPPDATPVGEVAATTSSADIMPPAPDTSSPSTSAEPSTSAALPEPGDTHRDLAKTESPKPASVPLQKVPTSPWTEKGVLLNTVYFARPGDNLKKVSQMIYGADKSKELKKVNASLKSRKLRPGDKIYYNSPHRADDSAKLITYYEDTGVAPETYVAKKGDNIRKIAKKLLSYDNAWREVWATNAVESKGKLDEGTELHYWKTAGTASVTSPGGSTPTQEVAKNDMTPPPIPEESAAAAAAAGNAAALPPPPGEQPVADLPPPPPVPQEQMPPPPPPPNAQNNAAALPPPPPPPADMSPPPPPPPIALTERHKDKEKASMGEASPMGMDSDTTMALAVVGLAAAGLAVLIVVRKKRKQRDLEHALSNDTQVGT